MRYAVVVGVLALLVAGNAGAQSSSAVVGSRVRVTAPNAGLERQVGSVTAMRIDSMVVLTKYGARAVALQDVKTLEVSVDRRTRIFRGALLGVGIGAVTGYAIGYMTYSGPSFLSDSRNDDGMWAAMGLGALGLATGAIVGAVARADTWVPATPGFRASLGGGGSGGIALSVSKAF